MQRHYWFLRSDSLYKPYSRFPSRHPETTIGQKLYLLCRAPHVRHCATLGAQFAGNLEVGLKVTDPSFFLKFLYHFHGTSPKTRPLSRPTTGQQHIPRTTPCASLRWNSVMQTDTVQCHSSRSTNMLLRFHLHSWTTVALRKTCVTMHLFLTPVKGKYNPSI